MWWRTLVTSVRTDSRHTPHSSPHRYIYILTRRAEGSRHGTHTNGTAYIRGTYSRVQTQTHTNTNTHTTRPDTIKYGADSRRGGAAALSPHHRETQRRAPRPHPPSKLHLCRDLPRRSYVHRPPKGTVPAARATSTSTSSLRSRTAECRFVSTAVSVVLPFR